MGDALLFADSKKAYTLTDLGTFLNYEKSSTSGSSSRAILCFGTSTV
jgi:ABC-type tungstate transport system permease subunit